MVPQATKDTGEDDAHLLEAEFENTYVYMRSTDIAANYIHLLDQLIQAVVTYKVAVQDESDNKAAQRVGNSVG